MVNRKVCVENTWLWKIKDQTICETYIITLRTVDADLRFYITTVQGGWRKSAF